jgi:hypothetical protein
MSAKRRKSARTFWKDWGIYLAVAGVILIAAVLFRILRSPPPELITSEHYRVYFTQGGIEDATAPQLKADLLADIAAAQERIELATPGLDVDEIANALVEAQGRGVEVRVLENGTAQDEPAVAAITSRLQEAGIPVALHTGGGSLGGTFAVIDEIAWAGSWTLDQRGLEQDAQCVIRLDLTQQAENFHTEFTEMFEQKAFGPDSPQNTPHVFLSIYNGGNISVYFTPEDDPFAEILRTMAAVTGGLLMSTEGIDDQRVGDRLAADSSRTSILALGVTEAQGFSSGDTLQALNEANMDLRMYVGSGRLRENFVVVDGQIAIIFSQPIVQQQLDGNDGYVIIIRDPDMGKEFQDEFLRLFELAQEWP